MQVFLCYRHNWHLHRYYSRNGYPEHLMHLLRDSVSSILYSLFSLFQSPSIRHPPERVIKKRLLIFEKNYGKKLS